MLFGHIGMPKWCLNLKVSLGHGFVILAEIIRRVPKSRVIIKIV